MGDPPGLSRRLAGMRCSGGAPPRPDQPRRASARRFAILLALLAFVGAAGAGAAPAPSAAGLDRYARPDRLVPVESERRIHFFCMGEGRPTVILTAGSGDWSLAWHSVQPRIAEATRVCAWDRAGAGFSDPSGEPQDVVHTTRDLERALRGGDVKGPYVLVGHSFGGFETLLFAFRHPREVAGIVLVDPSAPHQYRRFAAVAPAAASVFADGASEDLVQLRTCIAAARGPHLEPGSAGWSDCVREPPADYPPQLRASMLAMGSNVAGLRDLASLEANFERSSRELVAARRGLGRIPLIVLTAGRNRVLPPSMAAQSVKIQAEWAKMHSELAALSSRGSNRLVADSAHYIQDERPELVAAAITEVIAAAP